VRKKLLLMRAPLVQVQEELDLAFRSYSPPPDMKREEEEKIEG
jgi:hypothetical protein